MHKPKPEQPTYKSTMNRRESLKWLGALIAASSTQAASAMTPASRLLGNETLKQTSTKNRWPNIQPSAITTKGYGKDPNLIVPPKSPWPRTLSADELTLCAVLSDIVVPREGNVPSASEVNVPDVIDEWISAPYSTQQQDRTKILNLLLWLDIESDHQFKTSFVQLSDSNQKRIIENIAYPVDDVKSEYAQATEAFSRFKGIVLAAFFSSKEGMKDIGYMGNVPISGDYPGPSKAAKAHIDKVIEELGLGKYAYKT
ncbi:gluconate 2-dehydrogenase subunit 3 family protein [Glaciecola petra]|uniref:Gluconate 2-dehydrogenase subunit 3 family protein n=1 Tax=Glaciecola petra TaxID=3075602 RepID=A0ABU2ZV20_9ALTE|nr:gluconate 2-dehydrogenase subunit 3 family protein [Aestuariibacter sp. P117]MDT0596490.1 gluconate 2-dehydrogenase subunit 3 family protein [Aestuariibacter sp. P117]